MLPQGTDQRDYLTAGLNLIAQALSIYDSELRLVHANRRFGEMFGLPAHLTRPGAPFSETVRYLAEAGDYGRLDDVDAFVAERVALARTFTPHYLERTRANGRSIAVEGSPLPQGGWVAVYTDITEIRAQEALLRTRSEALSDQLLAHAERLAATNRELAAAVTALEEAKRQLTEAEARIRLTTEMMPAHIAHLTPDGRYTYSNRRLSAILPGRPAEIVGLTLEQALGPEAMAVVGPRFSRALAGEASTFEFTHEPSARRIRVAFTPEREAGGQVCGVYVLSTDITEETQARAALQQARRRAMAAQLTSGLAHDFANLLTIIMGTQTRLAEMPLPPEAVTLVDGTIAAVRRGGRLLERISGLVGARAWRPVPVEVAMLLNELETLARPALGPAMALRLDAQPDLGPVLLDPAEMQDALLNLLLNARDACGGKGTVSVRAGAVRQTWLEVTVSDSGPGFSREALEHALEPFFTTKGGEGSGLGLSRVYDMAKLAGGELRLLNPPGGGAEVRLRLPLRRPAPVPDGEIVLLAEDDDSLRAMVRDMLTGAGLAVIEATSVAEALALVGKVEGIGRVLSDIRLEGGQTGLDLLRSLEGRLPCHLMTSLPPEDPLHQAALEHGPVLAKPFGQGELLAHLFGQRREGAIA